MPLSKLTAATLIFVFSTTTVFAAGSDSTAPPKQTETTQKCDKGQIWDKAKKICVKIQDSKLDDTGIYENARELAYNGQYENALVLLEKAGNPNDPRILNYKAFTNRKMGNTQIATRYYEQALIVDPNYALARSYYGQAKVKSGDINGAKEQLALIKKTSGTQNWAYSSLQKAIKGEGTYEY